MIPAWSFYALLSAVFAALVAIFGKKGLSDISAIDSTLATTIRSIIMALFLVGVSFSFGKFKYLSQVHPNALLFITLSGIAGALSWLCYFLALQLADPQQVPGVAALDRLSVVFVLIFSVLFFHDKLTLYSILGAILLTTGAILMSIK
jgi:bacterial/archaeal transporter family protein